MAKLNAATLHLTDDELVHAVESCTLEVSFHHADHIRLAWIYLRMLPLAEAEERMAATLRRYSAHKGKPERYHHTMTLAWMRLVAAARRDTPGPIVFEEFIAAHPSFAQANALLKYYSKELLEMPAARINCVDPDLLPLP
jgi:hypothetical protein